MRFILAVTTALTLFGTSAFAGTSISGVKAGNRSFTVNNAVGSNLVKFLSDAPGEKINGTADGVTGNFTIDPSNLEATKGAITVQVMSMKTSIEKRDEHMYSETWLDAAKYPTISYAITGLKNVKVQTKDGRSSVTAIATGTFTCHGVTKPLEAPITFTYVTESAETKKRAKGDLVMVNAQFTVALKDHNITGKAGIVGSKVGEVIQIDAALYANS
jgi:polyisoprenoid-binding protein YceI